MTKERFDRIMEILGAIRIVANYILINDLLKLVESGDAIVSDATWEGFKKEYSCGMDKPPVFSKKSNDICTYDRCVDVLVMPDHCEVWIYDGDSIYGDRKGIRCKFHITGEIFKIDGIAGTVEARMFLKAERIYHEEIDKKRELEIKELKEKLINNK